MKPGFKRVLEPVTGSQHEGKKNPTYQNKKIQHSTTPLDKEARQVRETHLEKVYDGAGFKF